MAKILDGKVFSAHVRADLREQVVALKKEHGIVPGLAVILIGADPASSVYVANKRRACEEIGIRAFDVNCETHITQAKLLDLIAGFNANPEVHGILVQLPLPSHIDESAVIEAITPQKDVDGFHPYTIGKLVQRQPFLRPCTPYGVIRLLEHYGISPRGLHAVVVGASNIVGRPMALELLLAGATVTVCHRMTKDLSAHVRMADLLVVAVGQRDVVQSEWIKPNSIVVDVGIHRLPDGQLCGDVDYPIAAQKAAWITPVPGGVGPMTVAMLMRNVVEVAKKENA